MAPTFGTRAVDLRYFLVAKDPQKDPGDPGSPSENGIMEPKYFSEEVIVHHIL